MDYKESFLVLGIDPVKDERAIKNAYREKLSVTNPEDDPEGFKRLREAYEIATKYANSEEAEGAAFEQQDNTPSGIWVSQAHSIYANIKNRCNVSLWEEMFADAVFESLEDEENCREKLLRFLMDHFSLPTEVWKLFDKKMHLTEDADRLRECFPADFINFVLSRCDRGEDISFALFEGDENADYDMFLRYYDNCWRALSDKNAEEAERLLTEVSGMPIYHPAMEVCRALLLDLQGKGDEAVDFVNKLYQKHSNDDMVSYHTAEVLWKYDNKESAAAIFEQIKTKNEKHYMANYRLTEWYYEQGKYEQAKKCAEAVLSNGAEDSFMEILAKVNAELENDMLVKWRDHEDWNAALDLCWCYLQDGATSRGIRLAYEIKDYISEEKQAEYAGLLSKLSIEQGDYREAIEYAEDWEEKLKIKMSKDEEDEERAKDEDRVKQSYMIRAQAHRFLGFVENEHFNKAIVQLDAIMTNTPKDIGLLLEKAQIYMELEEYEKSLEVTGKLIEEYQVYAACATAMEVYRRQWSAGGVIQNAQIVIQKFPTYVRAYELLGRVYLDLKQEEDLLALLDTAKNNNIDSPYLEAYKYLLHRTPPSVEELNKFLGEFHQEYQVRVEKGEMAFFENGLAKIKEYFNWYPGPYMLRRMASYFKAGRKFDKAIEYYEKALFDEPSNPAIYANLSDIYTLLGNQEKALVNVKKALAYGSNEEWAHELYLNMAKIYMRLDHNEEAAKWFDYYGQLEAEDTNFFYEYAECLARLGRVDEAEQKMKLYYKKSDTENYDGLYRGLFDAYGFAGNRSMQKKHLANWKLDKQIEDGKKKFFLFAGKKAADTIQKDVMDYYDCAAWDALLDLDGVRAIELFERHYEMIQKKEGEAAKRQLMDLVLAAILFGNDQVGRKYAELIHIYLNQQSYQAVDYFYDMPKMRLAYQFLGMYYTASEEELAKLFEKQKECENCDFCLMPCCKELEAMHVLFYLKQGKRDEAIALVRKTLEAQPYDDYMKVFRKFLEIE